MASTQWIKELLLANSTDKYYIEYEGFLTNHMAHGIIAFHTLGASKKRILQFVNDYSVNLEMDLKCKYLNDDDVNTEHMDDYMGRKTGYYKILDYYEKLLEDKHKSIEKLVASEFPRLAPGLLGAALHGLIQTGYGVVIKSDKTVCEGLAYLHHSYESPKFRDHGDESIMKDLKRFGKGNVPITDILTEMNNDYKVKYSFVNQVAEATEEFKKTNDHFTEKEKVVYEHFTKELFAYVDSIQLSTFFDPLKSDIEQVIKLGDWIIKTALTVYVGSERINDFFLLHGVTSAWCLRQILPILHYEDALYVCRLFLVSLLNTYIIMGCPSLSKTPSDHWSGEVTQDTWKSITDDVLNNTWEIHVVKIAHVCQELYKSNPKDGNLAELCVAACKTAQNNQYCEMWGSRVRNDIL